MLTMPSSYLVSGYVLPLLSPHHAVNEYDLNTGLSTSYISNLACILHDWPFLYWCDWHWIILI